MIDFLNDLEAKEFVTFIGIMLTLFVGIINIVISTHKNRLEGITKNRMDWINSVRDIASRVISWRHTDPLKPLLNDINSLILYLNVSRDIDNNIIKTLLSMYDKVYKLSFYINLNSDDAQKLYESYYEDKQQINLLIRIYLKKEWTRVKAESQVWKIPFRMYWVPFLGFNEDWATESLMKKHERIKTYYFKPWVALNVNDDNICFKKGFDEEKKLKKDEIQIPIESKSFTDQLRQQLAGDLKNGEEIIVPDGKLAGDVVKPPDGKLG